MSLPAYDTIILQYQEEVTLLLNECVYKGYSALSSYLQTPLQLTVVLYISLLGISVMQGWTSITMRVFMRSALKIGIINLLAMNWGNFSAIVVKGFQGAASDISTAMLSATPIELPHFAGEGMTGALQSLLIEVAKVGNFLFQKGGITKLAPLFDGCVVWLTGILMIGMAFLELIMVQVLLATLLTAGPLFIIFTLFDTTRVFFQRWLGALSGCVFVIIFINITVSINMSILQAIIADDYLSQAINFPLVSFVPFYIVAILSVWQIMRVSALAMSLGGSIGSSSLSQQASTLVAGYMLSTARHLSTPLTRMNTEVRHRLNQLAKSEPRTLSTRPSDRVLSMGTSSSASSDSEQSC